MRKIFKEFWKYLQVRSVAMIAGFIWTVVFVDFLGFSGLVTAFLNAIIISPSIFLLHKLKGAEFHKEQPKDI